MAAFYICTIIKDEHRYLAEWIEHHLSLGFDDIYLFEDYGSKSHSEITDKYSQVHLITCDDYFTIKRSYDVGCARQMRLSQKFLNEHRNEGWCAFIDIDEYIMFNDGYTLQKLTEEYADNYGIALYWKQFNANGRINRSERVVESYTQTCECIEQDRHYAFKSLVNLNKAREFWSQHLIENLTDVTGKYVTHGESTKPNYSKVQLNHYFCKSYEDWCDRFVRGDLAPNHRKFKSFFENNPNIKELVRTEGRKFSIQLAVTSTSEWNAKEPMCVIPISSNLCAYNVSKCGCTTLAVSSVKYYKECPIESLPLHHYRGNHNYIESLDKIDRPTLLVYRDPISRWKSFYQNKVIRGEHSLLTDSLKEFLQERPTLEDVLYATEYSLKTFDHTKIDQHIRPISDYVKKLKRVDYFVDIKDLDRFLTEQGIEHSIENSSGNYNVELTEEQESLLKELYAEDYKLLDKYELWKSSSK